MGFDPHIAERRFGYGLSPVVPAPRTVEDMLAPFRGEDGAAQTYPLPPYSHLQSAISRRRRFTVFARKNPDTKEGRDAQEKSRALLRQMLQERDAWFAQIMMRRIKGNSGFRERMIAFWADHFTALGRGGLLRAAAPLYVEEAIRPNVGKTFADLLIACTMHPLMLHYLDQASSIGPNSRAANRRKGGRGLNENLARELLELHTLGVDGPYGQGDVRALAELLTGLSVTRDQGFKFRSNIVEPGAETVLGVTYAGPAGLGPIKAALTDLARHPATARHIAEKLAVHFISDDPPAEVVAAVEAAFLRSEGDLLTCYAALLDHPASWSPLARNIQMPEEFVSAALRALDVPGQALKSFAPRQMRHLFYRPLSLMGQPWMRPAGPDGFDEADGVWVTPQGISARLEWAMNVPARLVDILPEPEQFLRDALGEGVPEALRFAANAAEDRRSAICLILCSPAFQRR